MNQVRRNFNPKRMVKILEESYQHYHQHGFIEEDPISVPHQFSKKQDIEIAGLLTAIISWGQRKTILKNANALVELMDVAPFDFILNHQPKDLKPFEHFVHRTFNGTDLLYFIAALRVMYSNASSLEAYFCGENTFDRILNFRTSFFNALESPKRTQKHVANPSKGSAAKRINMYLKWMVRKDDVGIDFGLWKSIPTNELMIPLDVHVHRVSLELGLTDRKQADWKTVEQITTALRILDPQDPIRFDYALFMMGVEKRLNV